MKLSSFVILLAIITLTCMHCLAAAEDFVAQDFEESQYGEEDDHRWSQLSDNSYPGRDHGTSGNRDYQAVTPTSPWSSSNDGISLNGGEPMHLTQLLLILLLQHPMGHSAHHLPDIMGPEDLEDLVGLEDLEDLVLNLVQVP
ncbi:hypothetical protein DFQ28_002334 [Apophysomyces sp. BC1034]|nr:hypothetical protein DFQ28_002334 [Apophysomyces sp. BC1034]